MWLTVSGNLRCSNADEILLLLKSSDAVAHDLCYAYAQCCDEAADAKRDTPPQLVLKRWCALRERGQCGCALRLHARARFHLEPAMEFRCFVRGSRLVGACQRHTADFFPFLAESRARLSEQLDAFHDEHVADAFPHPDCAF